MGRRTWNRCVRVSIVFFSVLPSLQCCASQLILKSTTKYYSSGSIVADSHELAKGLLVITSGMVGVELPMDSNEADEENKKEGGTTLLYVLKRG